MSKRGASAKLWNRSIWIMVLIIVLGFGLVSGRLLYLQTVQAEDLQHRAVDQQLSDTLLPAKRGSIYDRNGNVLAQSVTVWDIVLEPASIKTDEDREIIARGLSEILKVDYNKLLEQTHENNFYSVVKTKVDTDVKDRVLDFCQKLREDGVSGMVGICRLRQPGSCGSRISV